MLKERDIERRSRGYHQFVIPVWSVDDPLSVDCPETTVFLDGNFNSINSVIKRFSFTTSVWDTDWLVRCYLRIFFPFFRSRNAEWRFLKSSKNYVSFDRLESGGRHGGAGQENSARLIMITNRQRNEFFDSIRPAIWNICCNSVFWSEHKSTKYRSTRTSKWWNRKP